MQLRRRAAALAASSLVLPSLVEAFRVGISDTDELREVCSGMYGGKDAYVQVDFSAASSGQVALVIYEWKDVPFLGVDTPDEGKTFICTSSAVRSGLCDDSHLGAFITSLPADHPSSSIFTSALRFGDTIPSPPPPLEEGNEEAGDNDDTFGGAGGAGGEGEEESEGPPDTWHSDEWEEAGLLDGVPLVAGEEFETSADDAAGEDSWLRTRSRVRRSALRRRTLALGGLGGSLQARSGQDEAGTWVEMVHAARPDDDDDDHEDDDHHEESGHHDDDDDDDDEKDDEDERPHHDVTPGESAMGVQPYDRPIRYPVRKTGYYCVGIVPVTLVSSRRSVDGSVLVTRQAPSLARRQANHAEYSGVVLFRNTFKGELPAVEYPKINLYMVLSIVYFALGCGWAYLCTKHFKELLPIQYYISGTILFLVVEMLAQWGYYRYINKHGGGSASLAFLFVISVLNAARNSLSLFLLLIVSMGLSVVTQSLGGVMLRVRILTALHFVFGVIYSVGVVQVELDSAALLIVLLMIFPLSFTLTAFLMWIIVSLNGTILHLSQRKQRSKLAMFQRLWRILVLSVIAVAAFFVVSTLSLSGRLEEDYAARNWRYRWVLLDASLAGIYLVAFAAVAWLWRPTRDNVRFAMSQELAQDEDEADAEDYEIDSLERGGARRGAGARGGGAGEDDEDEHGHGHARLATEDDEDEADAPPGYARGPSGVGRVGDENVVFQMGEDSDDDDDDEEGAGAGRKDKGAKGGAGRVSGEDEEVGGERSRLRSD